VLPEPESPYPLPVVAENINRAVDFDLAGHRRAVFTEIIRRAADRRQTVNHAFVFRVEIICPAVDHLKAFFQISRLAEAELLTVKLNDAVCPEPAVVEIPQLAVENGCR